MELRQYWKIIRRRMWIVIALPLIVLVGSLALRSQPAPLYRASMRFTIGVNPQFGQGYEYFDPLYYSYLASEYIADDFSEVVKSQAFAADVSARLEDEGIVVPPGVIQGSTVAEKQHRILTLEVTWNDPDQLSAIARAAADVLREENAKYFAQLGSVRAAVYIIDPPRVMPLGMSLREKLDIPIRLFLALVAALGLAFLLDYLDDTIREASEVEALGIRVLGQIPPFPSRGRLPWRRQKRP